MGAVVDVERGEHGDIGGAHAGDMPGGAGAGAAPGLVADGGGGEGDGAYDEQVGVLPPAHGGQHGGGGEHDGDRPVVPAPGPYVAGTALAHQGGTRPGDHRGEPGEH